MGKAPLMNSRGLCNNPFLEINTFLTTGISSIVYM